MALEFNTEPYYDDYEDSKQFYRILFKPGRAVQARELTQIQTILQKQISRFGTHVFKEGSLVSGAEHTLDDSAFFVKVKSTFGGNTVNFSNIEGKYILEKTGYGRICYVKKYTPATATDDITLHVTIVRGPQLPLDNDTEFDAITAIDATTALFTFETVNADCSGASLLFHINEGVFFAKETFLFCNSQTVVVGKYTKSPSAIVGLDIVESIVEADEDDSLLDPAVGSSNYLAPGADRYKISLNLVTKEYTTVGEAYEDFIEIIKVRNGELQSDIRIPIYSYLGDTLARRTYDESGDYIVKNFIPNILDNPSDNTKLILEITPGKAYVKGYEIETISPTHININKSRSTESIAEYDINTYYGNYTYVNTVTGRLPTINIGYEVEIHSSITPSLGTKIGTAQVRSLDYYSGTGSSTIFSIFLFDVNLSGGSFQTALSIVKPNGTNYTTPLFKALIDSAARTTALTGELVTQLFETSLDKAYFLIPQTHIKDLQDVEYTYKQHFYGNNVSSSTVTLTARTGDTFISTGTSTSAFLRNYAIVNVTTGERIPVDTKLAYANTSTNQVQLVFNTAEYDGDNIEVIATVRTPNENLRTKVLNQNFVREVTITDTNPVSLLKSDVYTLNNVFEIPSGNVYAGVWSSGTTYGTGNVVLRSNVAYYALQGSNTGNDPITEDEYWTAISDSKAYYTLNNGQKDNYYDHGSISRVSVPDTTGNVLALISYFTHDGAADTTGYISAESYPVDYTEIPTFVSSITGERISLRDYVDFRPRRADDTTNLVFESYRIPTGFTNINATIEYYLQRIDKVVLSREGKFKVLEGVPSLINPKAPSNQEDAITLYILELSAYTDTRENVKLTVLPYRRYTMKDIAGIDDRLSRMEFYTALSLLEEEVASKTLVNEDGAILFKNGYLVDSFKGHKVGDVNSVEYSCSIDYTNGVLRAPYIMNSYPIVNTTGIAPPNNTSNLSLQLTSEGIVTVPYTVETFVNQPIASKSVSVNPFDVVAFTGTIHLRPSSDTWFDTESIPQVVVNVDGENDNYQNFTSVSTQYNSWETIWSGEQVVERRTTQEGNFIVTRETLEVTQQQTRTGIETLKAPPSVVKSSTTNVVSESVIPYARAKSIRFELNGMAPFSELYLYINGRNCSSFIATIEQFIENDSGNANVIGTAPVITDNAGRAKGYIFLPNNDEIRFLAGEQNIVICDNPIDYRYATSFAQITFFSQGLLQTKQTTVISTRGDYLVTKNITENRTNKFTKSQVVSSVAIPPPPDPPVIIDTTPAASYSLQSSSPSIREGETLVFTLTAENAPTNRSYQANLSGSVNASDIGRALGNVTLTTTGTESINKAYLSVPITYDAVIEGTEFIELEVDIPADSNRPKLGGPLKLKSNVRVLDANIQTFTFTATPAIQQGSNVIVDIAAANLVSNTTVYYFANTTIGDDFTGNAATGTFVLTKPTSNHTLEFRPNGIGTFNPIENFYVYFNYRTATTPTQTSFDSLTQTRVLGNVSAVYNLSKTKPAVTEGESLAIVLETINVASTTTVPYVITGVSTADINGASLTGNFTVGSNGRAYLDVVTTNDGSAEGTEVLTLSLGLSSPNNLSIDVPIYDTGVAEPIYDVRALGNTIISEGGAITFEISTRNVSVGAQIPYAVIGTVNYVVPNTTTKIQTLGVNTDDITPSDVIRNNGTNYRVATIGANGNAYVTITSVEDQIKDGIKGGSFAIYPPDGKFVKFIILDTSNTRPWSGITVVQKDEINEGERLQYEIRLANTQITYPVIIPWSITPNREKNPSTNRDFLPWIEKAVGTTGDVQIKNESDWYGYVGFYQDVLDIYTDFREGTTRYAQGNPGTIWANGLAQYNDYINNSIWRQKAALGQIEFGKWHFENYGKAQNRQVPVFSEVRGNVTITGSETGYINLTVKAEKSRTGAFYVNFNQQGSTDKNGTTLEGSPLKTVTTKINYNQDTKPTAIDKLSRKIVGTGDFLDSRLTYLQVCKIGGNFVLNTAGNTAQSLLNNDKFPGKIVINSEIGQNELNTLAAYVLDRYRTRLNRNPSLNGFIAVLNRLLYAGYTPAPGSIYVSEALYDVGGVAWVNPGGRDPYGVWVSRERVWNVTEAGEYHIFYICDDGISVNMHNLANNVLEKNILTAVSWTGGWWAYAGSFTTNVGQKKLVISLYNCAPCGGPGYGRFIIYKPSVKDWLLQYFSYDDSPEVQYFDSSQHGGFIN